MNLGSPASLSHFASRTLNQIMRMPPANMVTPIATKTQRSQRAMPQA